MIPGRRPVQLHAAALIDQDAPLRTPSRTTGRRRPPTGSIRQLMKSAAQHRPEDEPTAHNRLRFEAISASIWLAFGLFALPAASYAVGATLLGPYQEDPRRAGLGAFYAEFFSDLAQPSGRAWWLAVG